MHTCTVHAQCGILFLGLQIAYSPSNSEGPCVLQAFGRALLRSLEQGRYANEGFVACRQLHLSTEYIIITRVHLLAVSVPYLATSSWAPALTWAAALGDIELCKVQNGESAQLSVLVMQPVLSLEERQLELVQKSLGLRTQPRSPWHHHAAKFEVWRNPRFHGMH